MRFHIPTSIEDNSIGIVVDSDAFCAHCADMSLIVSSQDSRTKHRTDLKHAVKAC